MILSDEQERLLFSDILARNGKMLEKYRWPDKTLLYSIESGYTPKELAHIIASMDYIAKISCIRFKERGKEAAYVVIRVSFHLL